MFSRRVLLSGAHAIDIKKIIHGIVVEQILDIVVEGLLQHPPGEFDSPSGSLQLIRNSNGILRLLQSGT
jgi:hypothetical protein